MGKGHYTEHIIYNEGFLDIMEEFKRLILKDERIEKYCLNDRLRFSAAIRYFIMVYVEKYSKSEVLKNHVTKLKEALELTHKKESLREDMAKESSKKAKEDDDETD